MRRIAIALFLAAVVVGLHACAADAPTSPRPNPGGGSSALQVQLVTSDANPSAGTCTLIEAFVSLSGGSVPDGTSVNFSTDFGAFSQNGLPLVSVVTTNGTAVTALCGPGAGGAKVRGTATVSGNTGTGNLNVVFQPNSGTLPYVSYCNPSFGPSDGGTSLTINGGRFFGTASTTRVQFTVNGVTKDGVVVSVNSSQVVVQTPGFTEFSAPTLPAAITLTFGTNNPSPVGLSLPSCFSYGDAGSGTPTVTAILPSSGTNEGGTRTTVVGSGFASTGVQVFFGAVEAAVISVSYNQVVVLSPVATAANGNLNATVGVTVRNIASGLVSGPVDFRYTEPVLITAWSNNVQPLLGPFSPVTIYGRGFQAPVAVTLAGIAAFVQSVSATELQVIPGAPLPSGCNDITGDIEVVNINTGSGGTGGSFTYLVSKPAITGLSPTSAEVPAVATIFGTNFPQSVADAEVRFGARTAFISSLSPGALTVDIPPGATTTAPACTGTNPAGTLQDVETVDVTVTDRSTTCSTTVVQAFTYQLPCVLPTPTP